MRPDANRNAIWARVIVEELTRSGVREVCISPGSRSTPLTLAFAAARNVHVHSHIDERCAGFFALGITRATGRPVALLCTSGSAGAHYYPAVIEANEAHLPLVVLTADRPFELTRCGAPQTINQHNLFGAHARDFVHTELPEAAAHPLRHLRTTVARLVATATGQTANAPGPVHLNVPFREPLEPTFVEDDIAPFLYTDHPLAAFGRAEQPFVQTLAAQTPSMARGALRDAITAARRGIIACGPLPHSANTRDALLKLACATGFVLLADPLSQLRFGRDSTDVVATHYDAYLRSDAFRAQHAPDLVLRFGAMPTSKAYRIWREEHPEAIELLIEPHGRVHDPAHLASQVIAADPAILIEALLPELPGPSSTIDPRWRAAFREAERLAGAALKDALADDHLWEAAIARDTIDSMFAGATLFVASSMPIRDLDTAGAATETPLRVLANRGANGIDGLVSTALGAAATSDSPLTCLIGDVAFLHDASGLLAASRCVDAGGQQLRATFVVINNDGGGIFSFLPIADHTDHPTEAANFERLYLTTHTVDIAALAAAYGIEHHRVTNRDALRTILAQPGRTTRILEVIVDRNDNITRHKSYWHAVASKLALTNSHERTTS